MKKINKVWTEWKYGANTHLEEKKEDEMKAMERRYPIGTKVILPQYNNDGSVVVGYNPPYYLVCQKNRIYPHVLTEISMKKCAVNDNLSARNQIETSTKSLRRGDHDGSHPDDVNAQQIQHVEDTSTNDNENTEESKHLESSRNIDWHNIPDDWSEDYKITF